MKTTAYAKLDRTQRGLPAAHASGSRAQNAQIHFSPRMVAQRQQLESMFGMPVQRQSSEEEELQLKASSGLLQRQGSKEEELLQGKFDPAQRVEEEKVAQGKFELVQRQGIEEEELLQGKFDHAPLQSEPESSPQSNNTGLPDNLKSGIESLSGISMDHVNVHYNSSKPAQLNALAYAQGTDIHVASGQEQHLPHEAWHVVQQAQGRVKPTMQMKDGVPVNDDQGLEHEADVMRAKAVQVRRSGKEPIKFPVHQKNSHVANLSKMQVRSQNHRASPLAV